MTEEDILSVLREARDLGCSECQFIGGEVTLDRRLPDFIKSAHDMGFTFIEVFTNLTTWPKGLTEVVKSCNVNIATSVYSPTPEIHDQITTRPGSWQRTITNLRELLEEGIPCRAGFIEMEQNKGLATDTLNFLHSIGVENVGTDKVRKFGRGGEELTPMCSEELCGECAGDVACVSPDGVISPCIMSKFLPLGQVGESSLLEIFSSEATRNIRETIEKATAPARELVIAKAESAHEGPTAECAPCPPNCWPRCWPNRPCYPRP
jgi:MoaA/NifB/PqqE/SkfB family radical SAM enzyme